MEKTELTEEEKSGIHAYLDKEDMDKQEESKRLELARRVFQDEEDRQRYGFTERALEYMRLSVA